MKIIKAERVESDENGVIQFDFVISREQLHEMHKSEPMDARLLRTVLSAFDKAEEIQREGMVHACGDPGCILEHGDLIPAWTHLLDDGSVGITYLPALFVNARLH